MVSRFPENDSDSEPILNTFDEILELLQQEEFVAATGCIHYQELLKSFQKIIAIERHLRDYFLQRESARLGIPEQKFRQLYCRYATRVSSGALLLSIQSLVEHHRQEGVEA